MMMKQVKVAVIGAGPSGLAAATELRRRGIETVVVERSQSVASSWRGHYDRLRLNTSRWLSRLAGSSYPRGTSLFPSRDEVVRYLEEHAARYELDIRLGVSVTRIDPNDEGWILRTTGADIHADHVVIATGMYNEPVIPNWPGRSDYAGVFVHSSEYREPSPFRGQDVLVVGCGSSGMDIALDLAKSGARSVRLAVRTPPNILLRTIGGLPGDPAALLLLRVPWRWADAFMKAMRRVLVGDLTAFGLPVPKVGPFEELRETARVAAIVDREFIDFIRQRKIEVVAGVESLDERGVRLLDGSRVEVGAVIAATGYRSGLERIVGHLGILNERGLPRNVAGEEAAPGLRFVGFQALPTVFHHTARQAKRVAEEIAGETARPKVRSRFERRGVGISISSPSLRT